MPASRANFSRMTQQRFENWLFPTESGLYCQAGDFHIDPHRPVSRAVITHGHSDHARSGHGAVLATDETIGIMKVRLGNDCAGSFQREAMGHPVRIGDVDISLHPAGHILGSAQIKLVYRGRTVVISGDYKRHADPTCLGFEPVRCDLFVTEATFGLPVFRHEPAGREIARLLNSQRTFSERTHLIGVYGLGKCQRLIMLLRNAGYDRTIWLHGAMQALCKFYQSKGISLGNLELVANSGPNLAGEIVMCPPSALRDRWSRRLADPVTCFASGWMRVRGRARQRGVELPLIISDHADWPELVNTIAEVGADEIWVTHGREDALVRQIGLMGRRGRALALLGREDDAE